MGALSDSSGSRLVALPPRCLIGRSASAYLRLEHNCASREHAILEWQGSLWRVRNLGSRNGTFVNEADFGNDWVELAKGDRLMFGGTDELWILADVEPPPPAAIADDGAVRVGVSDMLALPEPDAPRATVYRDGEHWLLDTGEGVVRVADGDTAQVAGRPWQLLLPGEPGAATTENNRNLLHIDSVQISFAIDRSEDHVQVALKHGAGTTALPSRSYHYLLLVLARTRLHDQMVRGLSADEAGWMDSFELAEMLKAQPEKLNVDVFRARRLFAKIGLVGAGRVIERRAITRQLRLGIADIEIRAL